MRQFVVGDSVSVGDFVMVYTLDWDNDAKLLDGCPHPLAYMKRMYARPHAPPLLVIEPRTAKSILTGDLSVIVWSEENSARGDG